MVSNVVTFVGVSKDNIKSLFMK